MPNTPNSVIKYQNGPLTPNPNGPSKKTPARSANTLPFREKTQLSGSAPNKSAPVKPLT